MAYDVGWLGGIAADAAAGLHLAEPLVLPTRLIDLCRDGVEILALDPTRLPHTPLLTPDPEFGILGADMTEYFDAYGFAEWMPGAWPLALDGGGGFFCLDLRAVTAGTAPNDGTAPIVWSHASNLGWTPDEAAQMGENLAAFLAATGARPA